MLPTTLTRDEWTTRAREHATAVDELTAGHRERRARGERHPVEDFLFTYYSHRPAQLRRWHPGWGVRLADAPAYERLRTLREALRGRKIALCPSVWARPRELPRQACRSASKSPVPFR